jgi:glucose/mannose-6-phosphate isomerase
MHDLDTRASYDDIDTARMHERIAGLAQQCEQAYQAAQTTALPDSYGTARHIVLAGMGGCAISSALAAALSAGVARVPITLWRDYGLPASAQGAETLVIVSSKSDDTEEAISAFERALQRGCNVIAVTTGGALGRQAQAHSVPMFSFTFEHTPREAIGWLTFPLIAILARLGFIPDPTADVEEAVAVMADASQRIGIDSPAVRNPAKRLAGQVMDRLPIIYGAGMLA